MSSFPRVPLSDLVVDERPRRRDGDSLVWNLNLDQIQSDTGRVLERIWVPKAELGPSTYPFDAGTVLYSKLRPYLNKVVIADDAGYATTELVPLRCDLTRVVPAYLAHFLRSAEFLMFANTVVAGAKMPRMVMSEFWRYKAPLPPLSEQRRIVAILDKADALRTMRREALAQLDRLAQSLFVEMFGDPVTNPKQWPTRKLGTLVRKLGSGATPTGGDAAYKASGISLIRSMNVHDGHFHRRNLAFIDAVQAAKLQNVEVEADDILLNITGASVARVCRAPVDVLPARVNQHVMIVRPTGELNAVFLERLLLNPSMKARLLRLGGVGATREAITKAEAEGLDIILPSVATQLEFERRMHNASALVILNERFAADLDRMFLALQHRAFQGEL